MRSISVEHYCTNQAYKYHIMINYPKITIVTPSYNQGQFLEQTILSVLGQNYPNLEYIIIDGESTDNSVEIIKKYEKHLKYWVSEPDKGQSDAINKGFSHSSGDILAWINSDDMYIPGVLNYIPEIITQTRLGIFFGNCIHFTMHKNTLVSFGSDVVEKSNSIKLNNYDYIIQPSTFWTRDTWVKVGKLREDMHFVFDWEWFLRAEDTGIPFFPIQFPLSIYRIHDSHKTGTGGIKRQQEIAYIYSIYNQRIVLLYDKLCKEDIIGNTLTYKLYEKLLSKFSSKGTLGGYLKIVKFLKYRGYTHHDIDMTNQMK